jgi:hypothetical protein
MQFPVKVLLGGVLLAPLVAETPSRAQVACPTINVSQATLLSYGLTGCKIGDMVYSHFSFAGNFPTGGLFSFSGTQGSGYTFTASNLNASMIDTSYQYKMTIVGSGNQFLSFYTTSSVSGLTPNTSKVLQDFFHAGSEVISTNGINSPIFAYPSPVNGPVQIYGKIVVEAGTLGGFTDSVAQTPGPLPAMGAAAAFGISRRLRRRIKQSS